MITIEEPPAKPFCASCEQPLLWAWLPRKNAWVSFVACPCGTKFALKAHTCRHAQDPRTWRQLDRGEPPNDDYLVAKKALKSSNETEESDG